MKGDNGSLTGGGGWFDSRFLERRSRSFFFFDAPKPAAAFAFRSPLRAFARPADEPEDRKAKALS